MWHSDLLSCAVERRCRQRDMVTQCIESFDLVKPASHRRLLPTSAPFAVTTDTSSSVDGMGSSTGCCLDALEVIRESS